MNARREESGSAGAEAAAGIGSRRCPAVQTRSWGWGVFHIHFCGFFITANRNRFPLSSSDFLLLAHRSPSAAAFARPFGQGKELGSAGRSSLPDVLDVAGQLFCSWGLAGSTSRLFLS